MDNRDWPDMEEVSITIDSGASNSVAPIGEFPGVPLQPSNGSRLGKMFVTADGTRIPNLGEKTVKLKMADGGIRSIKFQIADVNKILLSVDRLTRAGHKVVFSSNDPHIVDKSGKKIAMTSAGGIYTMSAETIEDEGGFTVVRRRRGSSTKTSKKDFMRQG